MSTCVCKKIGTVRYINIGFVCCIIVLCDDCIEYVDLLYIENLKVTHLRDPELFIKIINEMYTWIHDEYSTDNYMCEILCDHERCNYNRYMLFGYLFLKNLKQNFCNDLKKMRQ